MDGYKAQDRICFHYERDPEGLSGFLMFDKSYSWMLKLP